MQQKLFGKPPLWQLRVKTVEPRLLLYRMPFKFYHVKITVLDCRKMQHDCYEFR